VGWAFFPLDEELQLVPGQLTPRLHEHLVRLSVWIPSFARAVELLAALTGAQVEASTARRQTEAAGAAAVALEEAQLHALQEATGDLPAAPEEALCYQVDGVMVPLVGGQWAEVKQVAIGEVQPAVLTKEGETVIPTRNWSYFARLADADTFTEQATVELARRGVLTAPRLAAVNDGAEWIESFHTYHRPDVLRILDFPHAAQRVAALVEGLTPLPADTLSKWCQLLQAQGAAALLGEVRTHLEQHPNADLLREHLHYLEKRQAQLDYPTFRALGWPIASGAIESANKLVVEERLKGSGMHWSRAHVNPLLALRTIACSDRWAAQWPLIAARLRYQALDKRRLQRVQRQAAQEPPLPSTPTPTLAPAPTPTPPPAPLAEPSEREPYRPAPNHPWRHQPIGKARFQAPLARSA
jgi:hypothetical protein